MATSTATTAETSVERSLISSTAMPAMAAEPSTPGTTSQRVGGVAPPTAEGRTAPLASDPRRSRAAV